MARSPQEDKIICSTCGFANYPTAHFCLECEAPVSAHAVNDPFDTIKTTGWAYRKAQKSPRSPIVVVGIWLLFLPIGLLSLYALLLCFSELLSRGWPQQLGDQAAMMLFVALSGLGLYIAGSIIGRTTMSRAEDRTGAENDDDDDSDDGSRFEEGYETDDD